jgi:hypothetical protein
LLGGIVSMLGSDFERINGYPNLWGWGYEDNILQHRVIMDDKIEIDRSQFYKLGDPHILYLFDSIKRNLGKSNKNLFINEKKSNKQSNLSGLKTLNDIQWNIFPVEGDYGGAIYMINITEFTTMIRDVGTHNITLFKSTMTTKNRIGNIKMLFT